MIIDSNLFFETRSGFASRESPQSFPRRQILFIFKSSFLPSLVHHLPFLRSASFNLSIGPSRFPKFFCELLGSFMSSNIILHPQFVAKILEEYQNHYFLIEEDSAKLLKYLLVSVFNFNGEFSRCRKKNAAIQSMAIKWRYLVELLDYLKDLEVVFCKGEMFALELYCQFFDLGDSKLTFSYCTNNMTYLFSQIRNKYLLESLVENNPIISQLKLFLKKKSCGMEQNILEGFMNQLMLYLEDCQAKKKLENTQRTFDPLSDSKFLDLSDSDKQDFVMIGKVDKFGFFDDEKTETQYLNIYLKVTRFCRS